MIKVNILHNTFIDQKIDSKKLFNLKYKKKTQTTYSFILFQFNAFFLLRKETIQKKIGISVCLSICKCKFYSFIQYFKIQNGLDLFCQIQNTKKNS